MKNPIFLIGCEESQAVTKKNLRYVSNRSQCFQILKSKKNDS